MRFVYQTNYPNNYYNLQVSGSASASLLKMIYYRIFAVLYTLAGQAAEVVMVNSSWTCGHIAQVRTTAPNIVEEGDSVVW